MKKFKLLFTCFLLCVMFLFCINKSIGQITNEKDSLIPTIFEYSNQFSFVDTIYIVIGRGFAGDKFILSANNNILIYSHVFFDSTFSHLGKIIYFKNNLSLDLNIGVSEFKYNRSMIWSPQNEEEAKFQIVDEYNYPVFFYEFQYLNLKVIPQKGKYLYFTLDRNSKSKFDKYNLLRPYSRLKLKYEQLDKLPDLNK